MSVGAYGFRIQGAPDEWLSLAGGDEWPLLTNTPDPTVSAHDQARVDWGCLHADVCVDIPPDEIVHPVLSRMLTLLFDVRGIDAMHGGALLGSDGAWIVVGSRGAGKSSLLAACHRRGIPVMTDDVVVLEGLRCLGGPRCVDLRDGAARHLGPGVPVRAGTKQRIKLPPVAAEAELAGVVFLSWGERLELVPVPPSERLGRLAAQRSTDEWPHHPLTLLNLAGLPAVELRRPRRLDGIAASAALLEERLAQAAS
jgi:hypothetical protein